MNAGVGLANFGAVIVLGQPMRRGLAYVVFYFLLT